MYHSKSLHRDRVDPWKFERAKEMRKKPTYCEEIFWEAVRGKKLGVRFHRQKVIAGYIVDFHCPAWKMVVEIDGSSHIGREVYDGKRDEVLKSLGLRVVHITNEELLDLKKEGKIAERVKWM